MSRVTARDVGDYYLGPDGDLWRLLLYCDEPTATFERLSDKTRRGGAVGSPILDGFRKAKIVPEEEAA